MVPQRRYSQRHVGDQHFRKTVIWKFSAAQSYRKAKNCSKSSFSGMRTEFHKQLINTKCACQIPPQPRKAHNCFKSSFSGLWTEFQKQPINTKCACQSWHSPEKHTIASKARFRGCGRNSSSNQSIHYVFDSFTTAPKSKELLQKLVFGAVDRFPKATNQYYIGLSNLATDPKSTQLHQKLVFGRVDGIPQAANDTPQPRKAHNCSKSSFSGLWTEFHKQPMTDPTTAPKSTQLLQKLVFGAVDGIPHAANDRSHHNAEKQTIAPKARFRGCGRNSTSSQ